MSLPPGPPPPIQPFHTYNYNSAIGGGSFIEPHDHDILSGRGVNIAQHPGNERFRALVQTRNDDDYCQSYTTTEKRAVAQEIVNFIHSLVPPGRFLKRMGRANNARGLKGPWEELDKKQAIKKTCQALRDCNRQDRTGYAAAVAIPEDVKHHQELRTQTGLTNKEIAEQMAQAARDETAHQYPASAPAAVAAAVAAVGEPADYKRSRQDYAGAVSPSVEHAAAWLKKQKRDDYSTPNMPATTPTTAATSGGFADTFDYDTSSPDQGGYVMQPSSPVAYDPTGVLPVGATYADTFEERAPYHSLDTASHVMNPVDAQLDPLHIAAEAAAAAIEGPGHHVHHQDTMQGTLQGRLDEARYPPPDPFHPDHHHHGGLTDQQQHYDDSGH